MPKLRTLLRKLFGKEVPVVKLTADVARQVTRAAKNGEKLPFEVDWRSAGWFGYEIFSAAEAGQYNVQFDYHISSKHPDAIKELNDGGFVVHEGFISNTYDRTTIQWYPPRN